MPEVGREPARGCAHGILRAPVNDGIPVLAKRPRRYPHNCNGSWKAPRKTPGLPAPPFARLPLTVQLKRLDHSACWEATYGTAIENEAGAFRARAD
jgi:hypothetical protein